MLLPGDAPEGNPLQIIPSASHHTRIKTMSWITFPCESGHFAELRIPGSTSGRSLHGQTCLNDLIASDDDFLSHLEAIHYLSFPGY
jgi:hypothetical protein